MCLLLVASPGSTPKKKDLECSACNNPHGFGYAIIAGDKIITGRGMSAKKVIKEFLEVRKEYPSSHAIFHARYATHGVKNEENCHPFMVGKDSQTYLAHNGILDVEIHASDKRSDTRVFAEDTLPSMGGVKALDDDNVFKILSKWSSGSKIAVLTVDPNAKHECYIINENAGHWDNNGIWWSNYTYMDNSWSSYLAPSVNHSGDLSVEEGEYECFSCGAVPFEDANPYYCEMCYSCYDCNGVYQDSCMCWSPEKDSLAYSGKRHNGGGYYYDNYFDFDSAK